MPKRPRGRPRGDQRWSTFVRNHAAAILACDFCVVVTATFRLLYVLIVIERKSRRIVHCNVTAHPTAAWTLQQLREVIPSDHCYRFLIHDGDRIFSPQLDGSVTHMGLRVLKTPPRSPKAIGPGIPDPPAQLPVKPHRHRHRIPNHCKVVAHPVLGGLHHEYSLIPKAA